MTGTLQRRAVLHGPPVALRDRAAIRPGPVARLPFAAITTMMASDSALRVPPDHTASRET